MPDFTAAEYELGPNPLYVESDEREILWMAFLATLKAERVYSWGSWPVLISRVAFAMQVPDEVRPNSFEQRCCDFAETEGWHGVLTAFARVMREEKQ